jgi:hypothetical protein
MNQLPSIHGHFESPYRRLKHIQRFETSVFPTCYTVIEKWKIGMPLINQRVHCVLIHHLATCKYEISQVYEEAGQLKFKELS